MNFAAFHERPGIDRVAGGASAATKAAKSHIFFLVVMARFLTAVAAATVAVAQIPEQYVIRRRTKMRRKSQFPLLRCERGAQLTRTALSRLPHRLRRLHISLTGVAGQMALDFVAFADGQSVVYSGPSAAPTTVPANCTQA